MDIAAALKNEFVRPFVTLVVPGAVATLPYMVLFSLYEPSVSTFFDAHPNAGALLIAVAVAAIGLALEEIGTAIEAYVLDPKLARTDLDHNTNWDEYLKLFIRDEPIAQRYLREVLTRMKFELAMAPALLVAWVGFLWLGVRFGAFRLATMYWASLLVFAGVVILLRESFKSARILSRTRRLIIEAVASRPKPATG